MTYSSSGRSPKNTYFRQLPNLDYPSLANDRKSAYDYNQVKNIFKRAVLREDVIDADTGVVYEVHNTEPNDSLVRKAQNYPLEVRFVDANIDFEEKMLL